MTSASGAGHVILLVPLEDAESGPLRRWLGREAWLRDPGAVLRYERDGDRIVLRLVDTPSTAAGSINAGDAPRLGFDLFIGFDGTDADAWPTTIALQGFRRHCDQGTSQLGIVRELVGDKVWAAAVSLAQADAAEREMPISPEEASMLIRQWGDLVVSLDDASPSDEAIIEVLGEWSASTTAQMASAPAAGRSRPPNPPGAPWLPSAALLSMAGAVSRSPGLGRTSVHSGRRAGRQLERSGPARGGAAMARRLSPALGVKPSRPVSYGPLARLSDWWAARRDGNAGVPPLPSTADRPYPRLGLTPYMEIRNRHFHAWAERERRRMLTGLAGTYRMRTEVRQQIVGADERAAAARELLDSMPDGPPEPARRNAIEQHAPEELVRDRRRREFEAERARVVMLDQQAAETARELRVLEAQLSGTIAARERILDSRVRQLLEHSLRRCGTYKRHIVHHHPDGADVVPYLDLALPSLPDWALSMSPDSEQADAP